MNILFSPSTVQYNNFLGKKIFIFEEWKSCKIIELYHENVFKLQLVNVIDLV